MKIPPHRRIFWKLSTTNANLIVISGPSGVGKGTICTALREKNKEIALSISATTRKPRTTDVDGVTYFFKSEDEFKEMIENDQFLEWAVYNGQYYGTPLAPVLEQLKNGTDVLLEIDVQGALHVMEKYPEGIFIFIVPPTTAALRERLIGRGTETDEEINRRIAAAEEELNQKDKYEYIVINHVVDDAVDEILHIIQNHKK